MTDPREDFHTDSIPADEHDEPETFPAPDDQDDGDEPETGGEG